MTPPLAVALLGLALALAACEGENEKSVVFNRLTTPQQEATDLQRALDAGVISQTEYVAQRHRLGLP